MSAHSLNHSLLRPAIIHILRAAGFHSTKPSVLDTLTDLCARYLILIASNTSQYVYQRTSISPPSLSSIASGTLAFPPSAVSDHDLVQFSDLDNATPTIGDARLALTSAAFFASTLTSTEEAWHELLRKPLNTLPSAAQEKERRRRDAEDTLDVREFVDWATGPVNREIRRIAGLMQENSSGGPLAPGGGPMEADVFADLAHGEMEDYLTVLKKKHSKTGDVARYAGTILGTVGEDKGLVRIEGGPTTLAEARLKRKSPYGAEEQRVSSKRLDSVA